MPYIYSTLSASVAYSFYKAGGADMPTRVHKILIKGGANVAQNEPDGGLHTPLGLATFVSDEDLKLLEGNPVFQLHVKNGFIVTDEKRKDVRKVAKDELKAKDASAPRTPDSYKSSEQPIVNT